MNNNIEYLNNEELELFQSLEGDEWIDDDLTVGEIDNYKNYAKYTKSLQVKRQTTIRFSISDLALIKAKSKKLGIGYQNLIQLLVHNYATDKIKLAI